MNIGDQVSFVVKEQNYCWQNAKFIEMWVPKKGTVISYDERMVCFQLPNETAFRFVGIADIGFSDDEIMEETFRRNQLIITRCSKPCGLHWKEVD